MSLRKQRTMLKLTELKISPEIRKTLVESILNKQSSPLRLYAWDITYKDTAQEAFFTKNDAIKDWYTAQRIWEQERECPGVLLYSWELPPAELTKYIQNGKVAKIPLSENCQKEIVTPPKNFHQDMQQTVKPRSLKKQ
jgi:hypothetical protein